MSELKPCPFCGNIPELIGKEGYCVKCCECRASVGHSHDEQWYDGAFDTADEAIAAWNQRDERTCTLEPVEGWTGGSSRAVKCSVCGEMSDSAEFGMRFCPQCGERAVG